jgi:arsenate reductase
VSNKQRVLILCTGNSARSQMAEGLLRARNGDRFDVYSAGSAPAGQVLPGAITAMQEIGIDISGHTSKSLVQFVDQAFDYVLTVCDNANETCPVFPGGGQRIHRNFTDPAAFPPGDRLPVFRRVRDEIAAWLDELFDLPPHE